MTEEAKYANQLRSEVQFGNDSCIPYELPVLRKHGNVNATTLAIAIPDVFDGLVGFSDFTPTDLS